MNTVNFIFGKAPGTGNPIRRSGLLCSVVFVLLFCTLLGRGQISDPQSQAAPAASANGEAATTLTDPTVQKPAAPDSKPDESAGQKPMSPEAARQAQLVADTNRLYQLAQELQAEVAKSSKNTLSLSVVKKAAEVEKLARSLKERMKTE